MTIHASRRRLSLSGLALAALLPVAAAGCMPDRPIVAATATMAATTADGFVSAAMSSNTLEIESSRLALQRSRDPQVRRFAQHMITDHGQAARRMQTTLRRAGMDASPRPMEARHRMQLETLSGTEPGEFDTAYVELRTQAHQEAITLFSAYAERGSDAQLAGFARQTLPTLQMHARMLDRSGSR